MFCTICLQDHLREEPCGGTSLTTADKLQILLQDAIAKGDLIQQKIVSTMIRLTEFTAGDEEYVEVPASLVEDTKWCLDAVVKKYEPEPKGEECPDCGELDCDTNH